MKVLANILVLSFLVIFIPAKSQELERSEVGVIYKKERSLGLNLNTDGWGMDYRLGFFKTGYIKRTFDISFSFVKDPKEVKIPPYDNAAKGFIYGKEINFYSLRVLYGLQKDLTNKPYWGGVEIRWLNLFGFNLGVGKPIYLYVEDLNNDGIVLERYDKDKHNVFFIYGRGPYSKGLDELEFYPGISFKTALNVEYGSIPEKTRAIEAGVIINGYLRPYNIMAYSTPKYYDVSIYVSFNFGKRYNN